MKPFHAATMNNLYNTALIDMTKTVFVRFNDAEGYAVSVPEALMETFASVVGVTETNLVKIATTCDELGLQMLYVKGEK